MAIIKALKDPSPPRLATSDSEMGVIKNAMFTSGVMSPTKKVDLCSLYLKQLKEIQNLKDGVLSGGEGHYPTDS